MDTQQARWNFFTNHAHVLFYLKSHPKQPLRKVALAVGITERAVQRIVAELEEGGYLIRTKVGRQNQYVIEGDVPLRHSLEAHRSVAELLTWVEAPDFGIDASNEYKALENWTVGEHGSEV
ncbi:MAG: DNA-binding Lrp family transcriptional regulator [Candidatus Azotimanducaceae bacterium]